MFSLILNNMLLFAFVVLAIIIVWKISKTVIHMVLGLVILVLIAWGVYEVYKVGLDEVANGSGYFIVFAKGVEILAGRLGDILF